MVKNKSISLVIPLIALLFLVGCSGQGEPIPTTEIPAAIIPLESPSPAAEDEDGEMEQTETVTAEDKGEEEMMTEEKEILANIISVDVTGSPNQYQFNVAISSPDTGCEQYADWWEVLDENGNLIYRRILLHSHVNDQPFTRSGGPVDVDPDTVVIIRAHMNQAGYGGLSVKGTAETEFTIVDLPPDFAPGIEEEPPLPTGCNF
ncbi:MAG: hypothetical protein J7L35_00160 [Anaerolineales bacterium]|nr:hypothetical protein [Anaerolineales bacterium]